MVSSLYNLASPIIRYEVGDYAEVGEPCPCGRGLPVLKRILGRWRNMLTLPNGEQIWPHFRSSRLREIGPVRQAQYIQRSLEEIQVNLTVARPLTTEEEEALRDAIVKAIGHPFALRFAYVDEIGRSASGTFEQFRSELDGQA